MELSEAQIDALASGEDLSLIKEEFESTKFALAQAPKAEAVPPPPKTREQLDQEAFDAIKSGPFLPVVLREAAKNQYLRRLPSFIESTEAQIKQHAAMGADVCELKTGGAMNYHRGVLDHLRDLGFDVESFDDESKGTKLVVKLYDDWTPLKVNNESQR